MQDLTPYVVNSIGTMVGAVQAALCQLVAERVHPGALAVDMQMHFLAQVSAGPVHASATVVRDTDSHTVVDVHLLDAGKDDELLTPATVTLRGDL